jgi:hypothetical protein
MTFGRNRVQPPLPVDTGGPEMDTLRLTNESSSIASGHCFDEDVELGMRLLPGREEMLAHNGA